MPGGDQQTLTQRRYQEHRRQQQQRRQRAAHRHAEHEHRQRRRTQRGQHAEHEVRQQLADQDFGHRGRRGQHRLHGAALPFARHHQRGQQGADHGHDDGDGTGNQEAAAFELGVEPVARLQHDGLRWCSRRRSPARQDWTTPWA